MRNIIYTDENDISEFYMEQKQIEAQTEPNMKYR